MDHKAGALRQLGESTQDMILRKHILMQRAVNNNDTTSYNNLFIWLSVYSKSNSYLYYSLCMGELNMYGKAYYDFALGHSLYERINDNQVKDDFIKSYLEKSKKLGYKFKDLETERRIFYYDSILTSPPSPSM